MVSVSKNCDCELIKAFCVYVAHLCFFLQIFKPAIRFQFREPKLTEQKRMEGYEGPHADVSVSTEIKDSGPGLLELSKPSEFRLKALKQKKYLK